jgi:hypothetical protein
MKVNLDDPNPGVWFYLPGDPDGAGIQLRVCPPSVSSKIRRETQGQKHVEYKDGKRHEFLDDPDEEKRELLFWDYCIVEWAGLLDSDGKPVPCTKENKALLLNNNLDLGLFVRSCIDKLNARQAEYLGHLEKNL